MGTHSDKVAIICCTPWQVFGAINIASNNIENCSGKADVFIIDDFYGAEEICTRLKKEDIFCNVIFCTKILRVGSKTRFGIRSKMRTLRCLLFPTVGGEEYAVSDYNLKNLYNRYQKIFFANDNFFRRFIKAVNHHASFYMYDDGISSYMGNALMDWRSWEYRLVEKIRYPIRNNFYHIEKLYVSCKTICESKVANDVGELPQLNKENNAVKVAKRVFQFSECSLLFSHRFIILGQPLEGYNGKTIKILYPAKGREAFLVRKHPRQKLEDDGLVTYDAINNMWELECIFNLSDEHVLIACCSSAQITPKMLAGKEPYIIFVYKLFWDVENIWTNRTKKVVSEFYDLYKQKNKIFVPDNLEDYYGIVERLREKTKSNRE